MQRNDPENIESYRLITLICTDIKRFEMWTNMNLYEHLQKYPAKDSCVKRSVMSNMLQILASFVQYLAMTLNQL